MKKLSPELFIERKKSAFTIGKRDFRWIALIVLLSILTYYASQVLLAHYINGDQFYYNNFYLALKQAPLARVMELQLVHTGSAEPLYGYISWLFANMGFEKNTYIALTNVLFTVVVGLALKKSGAEPIVFLLLATNFYFVVLLTSAERLKFAYICFALVFALPAKTRIVFALIAPLFHFQMLVNYASLFLGRLAELRAKDLKKKSTLLPLTTLTIIAAFSAKYVVDSFGDPIFDKFEHYSSIQIFTLDDISKVIGLIIVSLALGVRFSILFAYMFPIAVGVVILGPERVNMIGFVTVLLVAAKVDKLMNPIFLILLSYFSFKTIGFVGNILTHGNGFV
ncbi:hypothetical protein [Sulfitobacter pontiacus]|uniref:hypothetical protein n=1 Tax=Sulfitobacter pontiacus TaxID=60137 RepID=UPI0030EB8B8F